VKTFHGTDGLMGEVNQCVWDKGAAGDGVELANCHEGVSSKESRAAFEGSGRDEYKKDVCC